MVIVLVGILSAVAVPRFVNVSAEAKEKDCWSKQASLHAAVQGYIARNAGDLPDSVVAGMFVNSELPRCPGTGTITYTNVGDSTYTLTCSQHGNNS